MRESEMKLDLVDELRLRSWAREHYVAPEQRDAAWPTVVLNEMGLKDRELEHNLTSRRLIGSLVPLAPNRFHLLHGAHDNMTGQNVLLSVPEISVEQDA